MQRKLSESFIEQLKEIYTSGTKVRLLQMNDDQAPPVGTIGEVIGVDDIGTIHIKWSNGSTLGAVFGEDKIEPTEKVVTICYKERKVWATRQQAMASFLECALNSEGSERERYMSILMDLKTGKIVCKDMN